MTPETKLSNEIKLWCGQHNLLCFHINQGLFFTEYGGRVKMDTPVGWPDLMVVGNSGNVAYIETKIKPRRPTKEQLHIQALLRERGFISTTVYTLDEFISIISSGWGI